MRATVGRIVHYWPVGDESAQSNGNSTGPVAAIITRAWSDDVVNLTVFPDNAVPLLRTSVQRREISTGAFAYWSWPERVE